MTIDRDVTEAARASVQREINWLKEERERLSRLIGDAEEVINARKHERQQIDDKLRKLEAFMHATSVPPRECATCKKQGHCSGPASGRSRTGCGFWSAREEELMRRAHAAEIELAKKRAPIIAVDFDGTLCENKWPGIGAPKWETVQALIAARAAGARLVLWTNRVGARLREAVEWARNRELEFDAVNENLPEIKAAFVTDCRKVYADIYLDDKAAQPSAAVIGRLWETARETMNEAAQKAGEEEQG